MGYVNGIWQNYPRPWGSLVRAAERATAQPDSFPAMPMTHVWIGDDNNLATKLNRIKAMQKHTTLPVADGLYWYFKNGEPEPRPVMINKERWGQSMKSFNGSQQSWLQEGEYLIGPQPAPQPQ